MTGAAVFSTSATGILDIHAPEVRALAAAADSGAAGQRAFLQRAHALIAHRVRPVYGLDEQQPTSLTLRRGRGSCSQRLAVLEAVARAARIPTGCRGLSVDGAFWHERFGIARRWVPKRVVLAWPAFVADGDELPVGRLFSGSTGVEFHNVGASTLFDAVATSTIGWDGPCCGNGAVETDLSAHVLDDLGWYADRDALFAEHGQSVGPVARRLLDPVLRRWSAGAG